MKLYWRFKKKGKWTWKPVRSDDAFTRTLISRLCIQETDGEEE